MECVYYGTGELRNRAQVQCGHVYIVCLFFFKGRLPAFYTHTALSHLLLFLHCCSFVFKSFRQCCSFNCGYVMKNPFPLSYVWWKLPLLQNVILIAILKMTKQS